MNSINKRCSTHKQLCIGINMSPQCDSTTRHCCFDCLGDSKISLTSKSYEQANTDLIDMKKQFKFDKETQNKKNLEILKELSVITREIQHDFNQILDQIFESINYQAQAIQEQQIDKKLDEIDLETFLSSNHEFASQNFHNRGFQQQLKNRCDQILQSEKIVKFNEKSLELDNRQIVLIPQFHADFEQNIKQKKKSKLVYGCIAHDEKIRLYDADQSITREDRMICEECAINRKGPFIPIITISKQWEDFKNIKIKQLNEQYENLKSMNDLILNQFQLFIDQCQQKNYEIQSTIDSYQKNIREKKINEQIFLIKEWKSLSKEEVLDISDFFYNQNQSQLTRKKWNLPLDTTNELQQLIQGQIIQIEQSYKKAYGNIQNIINKNQSYEQSPQLIENSSKINFQLLEQNSVPQDEFCLAIAFNKDSTIMIVGSDSTIKVFEFNNGKIKLINQLDGHTQLVQSLYFFKKSTQFISGGKDSQMLLWSQTGENIWAYQQISRNGHAGYIYSIISNANEDLLVSCSDDKSIKFWKFQNNEWISTQTLECHTNVVYSISLNESGDQLVSCSEDKTVKISKQGSDQKWKVIQQIELYSLRLCFIRNKFISLQEANGENIYIYEFEETMSQYIKLKEIQVQKGQRCFTYFPQVFNSEKQILLCKNGNRVNLIKVKNDRDFHLEQSIISSTPSVYGGMSNDGQYLVTWGSGLKQIEIRKNFQE